MKTIARLILILAILLTLLPVYSAPAQAAGSAAPTVSEAAVGLHSLSLSGVRPGGDIDLSGYVEVPYNSLLNPTDKITIEAWVKRNASNRNETIVGNGWQSSYWLGFNSAGKIRFITHGNDTVDSNLSVPIGVWTHIAVTYDGLTRIFYVNGFPDKTTTEKSGPLAAAPQGRSLGIGFDVNDTFIPNYFSGNLDEVRIWREVRTGTKIRNTMFVSFNGPQPLLNLIASWPFDGDAKDPVNGLHGIIRGAADFSNDGALPRDIRISQVSSATILDGVCNTATEYANATQVTVGGADVYLMHTATDLWICFNHLTTPAARDNWIAVYLDADLSRYYPAQPDDLALEIRSNDTLRAREGDGVENYIVTSAADGKWDGKYRNCCGEFPTRSAEFRISSELVGGWGHVIGLALAQHGIATLGDSIFWPALSVFNEPGTWSRATLSGIGAPRTFAGDVVYQPKLSTVSVYPPAPTPELVPIPHAGVRLIGYDANGSQALVDFAKSGLDGKFLLIGTDEYQYHRLELDAASLPKGYIAQKASAPSPGQSFDARTLDYWSAAAATYSDNRFTLGDTTPYVVDSQNGPLFLIVAPQNVISAGALTDFTDFKVRQGFTVEVVSVETVDSSFAGANRADRIRALEKARLNTYGSRFRYVMLIGTKEVIPYPIVTVNTTGKDGNVCTNLMAGGANWKYSDWYYVDLTSNFDSNNNGCLADGIWTKASDLAVGYTPDTGIAFKPTVALGRIPFNSPHTVRNVLKNSMGYEQQANPFKRQTVQAMSMVAISGYQYENGKTEPCKDKWKNNCVAPDANASFDLAYLGEALKNDFLNARNFQTTTLYEMEKSVAGGSPFLPDQPLTETNVVNVLKAQSRGFIKLGGHGNSDGVYRTFWRNDDNGNGQADFSAADLDKSEIGGDNLLTTNGLKNSYMSSGVYLMAACSTAAPDNVNNFAAQLLQNKHGVASIGGLNIVLVGSWKSKDHGKIQSTDYFITEYLLERNLRLGDAFWQALSARAQQASKASGELAMDLFGDPTLSYWGNPGGHTTLAAWPMLRFDSRGQSFTPLAGPGLAKKLWTYNATALSATTLSPSPVVSSKSEVIVAHGNFVDVLRQGALFQRLTLDAAAYGIPAIAADGTVYALDVNGKLYAFMPQKSNIDDYLFNSDNRYRRWTLALGAAPTTGPVIGPNGFIAVGAAGLHLVRPDGFKFKSHAVSGQIVGAVAWDGDQGVYVATTTGYFGRLNLFCPTNSLCETGSSGVGPAYSTPPLVAYGSAFAGRSDGKLIKFMSNQSFQADSAITAGPVAGPAGQILIGTQNGTIYSLKQDLTVRWQRNIGEAVRSIPAFSADALYIVRGDWLLAYDPFGGAPLWSRFLGNGAGYGSVAVGYGRELYMQTSGGKVLAYGEGWQPAPILVEARPVPLARGRQLIRLDVTLAISNVTSVADTVQGLLIQRSAGDGDWQDVAILLPGTTVFSDTSVMNDIEYIYRAQVLDVNGNDSEFTETGQSVQSLPALPLAPVLKSVTPEGADSLRLTWDAPSDVVDFYLIERGSNQAGPFEPVGKDSGEATTSVDTGGLTPAATYYYRLLPLNESGEGPASNVVAGTTKQRTLPSPQNLAAKLVDGDVITVEWTGAPDGATAVVELTVFGLEGYEPLGSVAGAGPFAHYANDINAYDYRVKFVQNNNESEYSYTQQSVLMGEQVEIFLYLPLVQR
jgi:hypothetical protein